MLPRTLPGHRRSQVVDHEVLLLEGHSAVESGISFPLRNELLHVPGLHVEDLWKINVMKSKLQGHE